MTMRSTLSPGLAGTYHADAGRLRQVLLNLLGNAVKFTEHGEIHLAVTRGAEPDTLLFEVTDTGIGIPPGAQPKLFAMFSQADAGTARRYGGTGLGLAISKRIVERMQGRIGFDSEPGRGSRFWFSLPLARAAVTADAAPPALQAVTPAPGDSLAAVAMSVLVAEDNIVNQRVASALLGRLGHHAEVAANGAEALRMIETRTYDLVLMDVQMPELDGLAASLAFQAPARSK